MKLTSLHTDAAILAELGERIRHHRLARNQTQHELADAAGVSKRTVERIETGDSAQLSSFLRVCRALGLVERFDALVPPPLPSPVEQLARHAQKRRRRARRSAEAPEQSKQGSWTWGDER
ncbi:MAG: helix-turn-helix transcriptional regulator [Sandaracinaceae bacterium]